MTSHEDEVTPLAVTGEAQEVDLTSEESIFDSLRKQREESATAAEAGTLIPIPGFSDPAIYARYKLMDGRELDKIAQRVRKDVKERWERQLTTAIDTFIAACTGLFYDAGDGQMKELTWKGEHVTGYNVVLQEALELPETIRTARGVVRAMFGNNEFAIQDHAIRLNAWFTNTNREVDDDFFLMGV